MKIKNHLQYKLLPQATLSDSLKDCYHILWIGAPILKIKL
jgi:hypothetical protein